MICNKCKCHPCQCGFGCSCSPELCECGSRKNDLKHNAFFVVARFASFQIHINTVVDLLRDQDYDVAKFVVGGVSMFFFVHCFERHYLKVVQTQHNFPDPLEGFYDCVKAWESESGGVL